MIQAIELRIGNWVYQNVTDMAIDIHQRIETIGKETVSTHELNPIIPFEKLERIPLSPEILLKCGFAGLPGYKVDIFYLDNLNIALTKGQSNIVLFGYQNRNHQVVSKNVKYLHQLQNLYYALTRKELIIAFEDSLDIS